MTRPQPARERFEEIKKLKAKTGPEWFLVDLADAAVNVALSFVPGRDRKEAKRQFWKEIAQRMAGEGESNG